eukprot:3243462-Prymnesium_polylepis.1
MPKGASRARRPRFCAPVISTCAKGGTAVNQRRTRRASVRRVAPARAQGRGRARHARSALRAPHAPGRARHR